MLPKLLKYIFRNKLFVSYDVLVVISFNLTRAPGHKSLIVLKSCKLGARCFDL